MTALSAAKYFLSIYQQLFERIAMPTIVMFVRQGKTLDQKRALVKSVTNAVVESLGVPAERVGIQIVEQADDRIARGGVLRIDK